MKTLVAEMKEWLCEFYTNEQHYVLENATDDLIRRHITRHYKGGLYQFYLDSTYYKIIVAYYQNAPKGA